MAADKSITRRKGSLPRSSGSASRGECLCVASIGRLLHHGLREWGRCEPIFDEVFWENAREEGAVLDISNDDHRLTSTPTDFLTSALLQPSRLAAAVSA